MDVIENILVDDDVGVINKRVVIIAVVDLVVVVKEVVDVVVVAIVDVTIEVAVED